MNGGNADMMEAEAAAPPPPPPPGPISDPNVVRDWLLTARQLLDQGKPSQALQAVVMAMKIQGGGGGGEGSVAQAVNRAREKYVNKIQTSAAADQLASLFAECAIDEATTPLQQQSLHYNNNININNNIDNPDHHHQETSILAESGRNQIVIDASSDGSSFVCLQCGGLVSNLRKEEHFAFWCSKT